MKNILLNEKQLQIANDLDNNILLTAPAGTGKTNTLICRIDQIIEQKRALPEEILCLTFTNKACNELKDRLAALLPENNMRVEAKTFHSFCYDVVRAEAKKRSDVFTDFIIFDEDDCAEIVKAVNDYEVAGRSLQNFIDTVKQYKAVYNIHSEDIRKDYQSVIERLFDEESKKMNAVCAGEHFCTDERMKKIVRINGAGIITEYNSRLRNMHGLDFTDLIVTAHEFFEDDKVASVWRKKYKYINIDEMQDTSKIEYKILSRLFDGNNVLLCGDYFQTIYEWRGSEPRSILDMYRREYKPKLAVLNQNYRSTRILLNASYACLNNLFGKNVGNIYKDDMKAANGETGEKIIVEEAFDAKAEAAWIYEQIQKLNADDISKIAVLTRSNKYNQRLSRNFNALNENVPIDQKLNFILVDEFKFFRKQEIKDVLAFLKLITNKYDIGSLKRILKKFAPGIGEGTLRTIDSEEYRRAGISLTDFIDKKTYAAGQEPFSVLLQGAEDENIIVFDVESTGTDISKDEIIQIAAVRLDKSGKIKEKFVRLLRPGRKVGNSYYVHGFSDEYLEKNGEATEEVLRDFLVFSEKAVIVGHNVGYDISILRSELSRRGLNAPGFLAYYDTLEIFRRFYPRLSNHKLSFLSDYFAIKEKPTHDALDDVLATASLLFYAIRENIKPAAQLRREYVKKHADKFRWIAVKMEELTANSYILRPYELIAKIMNVTEIKAFYKSQPERIDKIREFYLIAKETDDPAANARDAAERLLKMAALSNSEMDRMLMKVARIPIITIHQSKGTEFEYVFLAGMHEGIFPAYLAIKENTVEEEKRLFYVAITRAKKRLCLSWSKYSEHGRANAASRFIESIPAEFVSFSRH